MPSNGILKTLELSRSCFHWWSSWPLYRTHRYPLSLQFSDSTGCRPATAKKSNDAVVVKTRTKSAHLLRFDILMSLNAFFVIIFCYDLKEEIQLILTVPVGAQTNEVW